MQQLRSILYESMLKIMIPENWAEKPPPPKDERKFFDFMDLSISSNFEQLWFLWQKSPPPLPGLRENFLTPDLSISGISSIGYQLWSTLWQK